MNSGKLNEIRTTGSAGGPVYEYRLWEQTIRINYENILGKYTMRTDYKNMKKGKELTSCRV